MRKFEEVKGERQLMYEGKEYSHIKDMYNDYRKDGNKWNSSYNCFEKIIENELDQFFDWSTSDFENICDSLEVVDGYYVYWVISEKICIMAFAG